MRALIDAVPTKEYLVLAVLVAVFLVANLLPLYRRVFDGFASGLAGWLRRRGLFTLTDPLAAQRRLDICRVLLALAALYRCQGNLAGAWHSGGGILAAQLISMGLAFAMLVGFATPLVIALIILTQNLWLVPVLYRIANLPSAVMTVALIPLLMCPAGRTLSVDALFLERKGLLGGALRRLYACWGDFHPDRLTLGLFAAMFGYWMVCLSATLFHLEDPSWRSGLINATLLTSPFINPYLHEVFDGLYWLWPAGFVVFARTATWGMLVWEASFFPAAIFRWGRAFVVVWGLMFFFMSVAVLRLNYLVAAEVALYVILFWQKTGLTFSDAERLTVTASPGLCGWLARLDLFGSCVFRAAAGAPLRVETAAGGSWHGARAFLRLTGAVVLLWPLLPVVGLAALFVRSAKSPRTAGATPTSASPPDWAAAWARPATPGVMLRLPYAVAGVLMLAFALVLPGMESTPRGKKMVERVENLVARTPRFFGLSPVLVFDARFDNFSSYLHLDLSKNCSTPEALRYRTRQWFSPYRAGCQVVDLAHFPEQWEDLVRNVTVKDDEQPCWIKVCLTHGATEADLRAGRYVPWRKVDLIVADFDPETRRVVRTSLGQEGLDAYLKSIGMDAAIDADKAWLLRRFPVKREIDRLVRWYEHKPEVVNANAERTRNWAEMVRLLHEQHDVSRLLPAIEKVCGDMGVEWRPDANRPPAATCHKADLDLARHYFKEVFSEPMRLKVRPSLERAEKAAQAGDSVECILRAAEVRRFYFDELYLDR